MFEYVYGGFAGLDSCHPWGVDLGVDFLPGDLPGRFFCEELMLVKFSGSEVVDSE